MHAITGKPKLTANRISEQGFSLLELLLSMTIFLVVTGSIYGLLQVGRVDGNRASQRADLMKNARLGIHLIGKDVLNAGLGYNRSGALVPDDFISTRLKLPTTDSDTDRDVLTGITGGNDVFSNIYADKPEDKTDIIAFAYRDIEFNDRDLISITNAGSGSSASVARAKTLKAAPNNAANVKPYDLYLLESSTTQLAVMATGTASEGTATEKTLIDFATGTDDPLSINQKFDVLGEAGSLLKKCTSTIKEDCSTYVDDKTPIYSVKRFYWVSYSVKSDGTLVRTVYGNNRDAAKTEQIQETPLASNIKDLQFKYVMSDGSVTDDPANWDTKKATNFNLVRQIIVTIKVQTNEVDPQTRKPLVITLTSAFSTRNIEYDAG